MARTTALPTSPACAEETTTAPTSATTQAVTIEKLPRCFIKLAPGFFCRDLNRGQFRCLHLNVKRNNRLVNRSAPSGQRTPESSRNKAPASAQKLPRISDSAGDRAGRHCHGGGQKHLRFLVPHAAWEIAVGGADALHRRVDPAELVGRSAQARGATGVFGHFHPGIHQDFPNRFFTPA